MKKAALMPGWTIDLRTKMTRVGFTLSLLADPSGIESHEEIQALLLTLVFQDFGSNI